MSIRICHPTFIYMIWSITKQADRLKIDAIDLERRGAIETERNKKKNREKAFVHKQLYYHSTRHNLCSNKAFPNLLPDLHIYVCWFAFLNKIIEWQNIYSKDIEAHWCIFSNHFNFSRNIFGCKFFVCFFVH